jgi:outer membrane receptor protein involved in Fe transport
MSVMVATCFAAGYAPRAAAQEKEAAPLEEIVVTAQKRSEVLAKVPLSISVLTGDALERQQADNFLDFAPMVPGLSLTSGTNGVTRLTLRGVNTGGVATTVGVYVDDVPFGSSSGLANAAILSGDFDTFDLARIEVLRGPQGTLYGASSLGGVLKYVTNAPNTEAFEARAQASMESVSGGDMSYAVTGVVNVPVSDSFAIRATGFYRHDGGFIDSIGDNPIPSLTDPNVNVVQGTRVEKNINSVASYGGRVSALFQPSDRFSMNLMVLMQNLNSDSSNIVDADPVTLKPLHSDPVRSRYQLDYTDIQYRIYSATLNWDFGGTSLESVTSYSKFNEDFQTDAAANTQLLGVPTASATTFYFGDPTTRPLSAVLDQITKTDKFTQELRLLSAEDDSFEWLLGLYYTKEDSGIDPQELLAVEAGTETLASDIPALVQARLPSNYKEYAVFANATWHITPRFDLSFGGRSSKDEQSASQVLQGALLGTVINFDEAKSSESPFTYSISPRFEVSDNVSIFARVATGYRPGGPNVLPPGAPPGTPGSYDSDSLTSYEIGLKADAADGRFGIDFTAYELDWEDIQLLAVVNGIGINANGGTAKSKGFEFTATVRPTDGLTFGLNGAYTDAYLTQDTDPIVGGTDGDPLTFVPDWSYSLLADYEWPVSGDKTAYVGGLVSYVGDRPAVFGNRAPDGSIRQAGSYTTVNLRAGLDAGRWSVELYAKNLTDEFGVSSIEAEGSLPNGAVGLGLIRPRTFGLSVGARF